MIQVSIYYLYDIYKNKYSDELNENLLSLEEFVEKMEDYMEDQIRAKEF